MFSKEEKDLPKILASYGGTLAQNDRRILHQLQQSDSAGRINFAKFFPVIWGSAASEKYENFFKLGPTLWNRPSESDILDCIDPQILWMSSIRFPLNLSLKSQEEEDSNVYFESMVSLYDPRFFLPLFASILGPECLVDCQKFMEKNCLCFVLCGLSSRSSDTRSLCYLILSNFLFHLKSLNTSGKDDDESTGKTVQAKTQLIYTLTVFKNSIEISNERIPCIISHFLARVCNLLLRPHDRCYGPISSFLLLKPTLDLKNVPEFYRLFHSSSPEHFRYERVWILYLLADGLREVKDYRMIEKRYGFKLLMSYFNCPLADSRENGLILRILKAATNYRTSTVDLCRKHNLLGWLSANFLVPTSPETVSQLLDVFLTACRSLGLPGDSAAQTSDDLLILNSSAICTAKLVSDRLQLDEEKQHVIHQILNLL